MYNVSKVACNCGFRGEVPVGRLMDIACGQCWTHKRELRECWAEDGDEVRILCDQCQDWQRAFARAPRKNTSQEADMEYKCEGCAEVRPISAEQLLRSQGLACCDFCSWVGYPAVVPRGQSGKAKSSAPTFARGGYPAVARSAAAKAKPRVQPQPSGAPTPPSSRRSGGYAKRGQSLGSGGSRGRASGLSSVVPVAAGDD
eukprot:CAMPEP_0117506782 /NCGR_PEP_ID=MMETSP0784-20121206/26086_1 /TAXON_ID=39447 /ORGANISM="" /LENGTH=199 /DNA_ID=CAMNT_0005302267 /DNA_START=384 /DNA_END=983 /DNA_ORIENTATION=+